MNTWNGWRNTSLQGRIHGVRKNELPDAELTKSLSNIYCIYIGINFQVF